jgi:transmembrane sensor
MDAGTHKQIEDRAAAWLAKRDAGGWSADDEAQLRQWIDASVAHRVAFLRLETVWNRAGRLKALGAGLPAGTSPSRGKWRESPFFASRLPARSPQDPEWTPALAHAASAPGRIRPLFRSRILLAAAASLLLLMSGGAVLLENSFGGQQYSTPVGGLASVPLADGSNVTLDTASRIRVQLRRSERRVHLLGGQAFFVVAKDARRPFVVQAAGSRVVAVGTQFSVRRDRDVLWIVVAQGTVRLDPASASPPGSGGEPSLLTAGTVARVSHRTVLIEKESPDELEGILSWREGHLTFHEATLAEAVAEFNRYNTHKITIADPRVADILISGTFRPTHVAAFVRLLASGFSVRAIDRGDTTTLSLQ